MKRIVGYMCQTTIIIDRSTGLSHVQNQIEHKN